MSANPLKAIRSTFVDAIGPRATHAAEAGFVLSVLLATLQYFPQYAALLAGIFGIEKALKKFRNSDRKLSQAKLYPILKAIVPTAHLKHIRVQPIYFIVASGIGYGLVYLIAVLSGRAFLLV